jgi:bifunctional DNA-binding transcriptional regulator/antitoxin component of YhaV-PrlF toxin-antitoxin module
MYDPFKYAKVRGAMAPKTGVAALGHVQARGQVTVPQEIREACGIEPGSDLYFRQTGPDTFECHVLPAAGNFLELAAQHACEGPAPSMEELREQMGDDIARELLSRYADDLPA